MQPLPDFEMVKSSMASDLSSEELAECHGLLLGLLCGGMSVSTSQYLLMLQQRDFLKADDGTGHHLFNELLQASIAQLADEQMGLVIWLPDDDELLSRRVAALGGWCSGYLTGLTEACGSGLNELSAEATELITDISNLSQVELDSTDDPEESEDHFMEIVEYLRVAALVLQEEFRPEDPDVSVH